MSEHAAHDSDPVIPGPGVEAFLPTKNELLEPDRLDAIMTDPIVLAESAVHAANLQGHELTIQEAAPVAQELQDTATSEIVAPEAKAGIAKQYEGKLAETVSDGTVALSTRLAREGKESETSLTIRRNLATIGEEIATAKSTVARMHDMIQYPRGLDPSQLAHAIFKLRGFTDTYETNTRSIKRLIPEKYTAIRVAANVFDDDVKTEADRLTTHLKAQLKDAEKSPTSNYDRDVADAVGLRGAANVEEHKASAEKDVNRVEEKFDDVNAACISVSDAVTTGMKLAGVNEQNLGRLPSAGQISDLIEVINQGVGHISNGDLSASRAIEYGIEDLIRALRNTESITIEIGEGEKRTNQQIDMATSCALQLEAAIER